MPDTCKSLLCRKVCVTIQALKWGNPFGVDPCEPMSETWTISVSDRVYGPYSLAQMRAFHGDGRLAAHSLIARSSEEQFHPAREDADLACLFPHEAGIDADPSAASAVDQAVPNPAGQHEAARAASPTFGRSDNDTASGPSHYVIMADMKSRAITDLEKEIFSLGTAQRCMPQTWVLTSEVSLNTVRNQLVQTLGKIDTLLIVDAAHDKAAWFNFGPENDARMRRMWSRPQPYHGIERRTARRA
jgi:hypothetical protein